MCSFSSDKHRFAVKWASESLFTLLLFPGLSQTDTYLSEMWQKCHIASGEWEKFFMYHPYTLVPLYLIYTVFLIVCYFVFLRQLETAGSFVVYIKLILKMKCNKPNFNANFKSYAYGRSAGAKGINSPFLF